MELHRRAFRAGIQPGDIGALGHGLDADDVHQHGDLARDRAETVDEFGGKPLHLDL